MTTLYAVMTMGIITFISYDHEGEVKWVKAIFGSEKEASSHAGYMNEINHGIYTVQPIAVRLRKGERGRDER